MASVIEAISQEEELDLPAILTMQMVYKRRQNSVSINVSQASARYTFVKSFTYLPNSESDSRSDSSVQSLDSVLLVNVRKGVEYGQLGGAIGGGVLGHGLHLIRDILSVSVGITMAEDS